jgi:hypothetical protein
MNKSNADRMGYYGARDNKQADRRKCHWCEYFTWWDVHCRDGGFDSVPSCQHPMAPEGGRAAKVALHGICDKYERKL